MHKLSSNNLEKLSSNNLEKLDEKKNVVINKKSREIKKEFPDGIKGKIKAFFYSLCNVNLTSGTLAKKIYLEIKDGALLKSIQNVGEVGELSGMDLNESEINSLLTAITTLKTNISALKNFNTPELNSKKETYQETLEDISVKLQKKKQEIIAIEKLNEVITTLPDTNLESFPNIIKRINTIFEPILKTTEDNPCFLIIINNLNESLISKLEDCSKELLNENSNSTYENSKIKISQLTANLTKFESEINNSSIKTKVEPVLTHIARLKDDLLQKSNDLILNDFFITMEKPQEDFNFSALAGLLIDLNFSEVSDIVLSDSTEVSSQKAIDRFINLKIQDPTISELINRKLLCKEIQAKLPKSDEKLVTFSSDLMIAINVLEILDKSSSTFNESSDKTGLTSIIQQLSNKNPVCQLIFDSLNKKLEKDFILLSKNSLDKDNNYETIVETLKQLKILNLTDSMKESFTLLIQKFENLKNVQSEIILLDKLDRIAYSEIDIQDTPKKLEEIKVLLEKYVEPSPLKNAIFRTKIKPLITAGVEKAKTTNNLKHIQLCLSELEGIKKLNSMKKIDIQSDTESLQKMAINLEAININLKAINAVNSLIEEINTNAEPFDILNSIHKEMGKVKDDADRSIIFKKINGAVSFLIKTNYEIKELDQKKIGIAILNIGLLNSSLKKFKEPEVDNSITEIGNLEQYLNNALSFADHFDKIKTKLEQRPSQEQKIQLYKELTLSLYEHHQIFYIFKKIDLKSQLSSDLFSGLLMKRDQLEKEFKDTQRTLFNAKRDLQKSESQLEAAKQNKYLIAQDYLQRKLLDYT
jgi:hypothetical protein